MRDVESKNGGGMRDDKNFNSGIGMQMFVVAAWRDENIGGMRGLKSLFRTLLTEP